MLEYIKYHFYSIFFQTECGKIKRLCDRSKQTT